MNRRVFLRRAASTAGGALGVLGGWPFGIPPAMAWIIDAIQIASATASLVSKFGERGDGGLTESKCQELIRRANSPRLIGRAPCLYWEHGSYELVFVG
jgi:hypothetical protein